MKIAIGRIILAIGLVLFFGGFVAWAVGADRMLTAGLFLASAPLTFFGARTVDPFLTRYTGK